MTSTQVRTPWANFPGLAATGDEGQLECLMGREVFQAATSHGFLPAHAD